MSLFYLIPLGLLLVHAFWSVDYQTIDRTFTLENVQKVFSNPLYPTVLLRTVLIAAAVTLTDMVLAFPIAFYLAKRVTKHRELLLLLVVFPLWSSYLVRAFAWKTILGTNGILNSFLLWTGIVDQPVAAFLYSKTAMYITFSQVWLPFMILPLYTILDRMPNSLLEASSDLGSNWFQTFRRVVFPLALPGLLAGSLSVFSLTMGDYITPSLIGGSPGTELIGGIIADQFGVAYNWPLGAALISGEMPCLSRPQIRSGNVFSRPVRKNVTITSSNDKVNARIAPARIAGRTSGNVTRQKVPHGFAPRSADASVRLRGICPSRAMTLLRINVMQKVAWPTMIVQRESCHPIKLKNESMATPVTIPGRTIGSTTKKRMACFPGKS